MDMDWRRECAALIPCFNEELAIGDIVGRTRRYLEAVFVIDDGSSDRTAALARQAGAEILSHPANLGKGAALQSGWQLARARHFRWVITLDGDGQHAPEDIPALLECAERTSAAIVIGNRMANPAGMPWVRKVVNHWMSRRLSAAARQFLPDSQCGFRLIDLEALAALPISAGHFEIESEVLLALAQARRKIEFVPIQVIYKNEQSKIHPLRDTLRWFRWWRGASKQ
jgi:glycosyltransferase involved in cell wall biosynthesis